MDYPLPEALAYLRAIARAERHREARLVHLIMVGAQGDPQTARKLIEDLTSDG